jgi:hypothetical protein
VKLLSAPQSLDEAAGRYSGADPGTDVVMTFTVHELLLSEKPSSRGLKAVFTAGMYDKEVMPYFSAHMGVYRRQEGGAS